MVRPWIEVPGEIDLEECSLIYTQYILSIMLKYYW